MREKYLGGFWRESNNTYSGARRKHKSKRSKKWRKAAQAFYQSQKWLELRYAMLKNCNGCCQLCGQRATPDNPLHVDHIKPRSTHRHLQLDMSNLQVLCRACNIGKSNLDVTDWRAA